MKKNYTLSLSKNSVDLCKLTVGQGNFSRFVDDLIKATLKNAEENSQEEQISIEELQEKIKKNNITIARDIQLLNILTKNKKKEINNRKIIFSKNENDKALRGYKHV